MRGNLIAGLDIGTTKTSVVIAELVGDPPRHPELKILGVGQARTSGIRREVVTHIEETTDTIRSAMSEAEIMAGVNVDRVYVGIAGEHIFHGKFVFQSFQVRANQAGSFFMVINNQDALHSHVFILS